MRKACVLLIFSVVAVFLGLSGVSSAQVFGSGVTSSPAPKAAPAKPFSAQTPQVPAPQAQTDDDDDEDETPDREGSSVFQIKFIGDQVVLQDKPKILMYMRNFKISRNINGTVNCDMRFYVMSNLSEKITNISYRLKWPEMETALSFDDVEPNKAVYYDYALLGKGCYNMDKAPNIIVNRCRVKGMSQQDCANAIEWLN